MVPLGVEGSLLAVKNVAPCENSIIQISLLGAMEAADNLGASAVGVGCGQASV